MRFAISFLLSKNFQLFVKKKCSLLYPDRGIPIGTIPQPVDRANTMYEAKKKNMCVYGPPTDPNFWPRP